MVSVIVKSMRPEWRDGDGDSEVGVAIDLHLMAIRKGAWSRK